MGADAAKASLAGEFITFEGIDGCGKSTQARRLAAALRARGCRVTETREPGGTAIGAQLREVLLNPAHTAIQPESELLLFLADRVQHLGEVILPALARGETVICDRFHDSTVAFQQYGRGLDFAAVASVIEQRIAPAMPALTLWLDLELGEAAGRIGERQAENLRRVGERMAQHLPLPADSADSRLENETVAFHQKVRDGYRAIHAAEPGRVARVEGGGTVEEVAAAVWAVVGERFHVP